MNEFCPLPRDVTTVTPPKQDISVGGCVKRRIEMFVMNLSKRVLLVFLRDKMEAFCTSSLLTILTGHNHVPTVNATPVMKRTSPSASGAESKKYINPSSPARSFPKPNAPVPTPLPVTSPIGGCTIGFIGKSNSTNNS
eukprot:CAMPEP_0172519428 /NCGR_PEP_ID=MMETSP1066-20121228/291402_1 /TAXON_ID=671091 /ORGANISM="Coscinodiscus wailesii, Strain CCMP2513" /LENGTH=137 /DNA_ID=CAMNT_0013302017 /DNA_START=724 /DNA_END=1137 /DNA_ORIENTATION=-